MVVPAAVFRFIRIVILKTAVKTAGAQPAGTTMRFRVTFVGTIVAAFVEKCPTSIKAATKASTKAPKEQKST